MNRPEVSVVVPHLAGGEILTACLAALEGQSFRDFETILVDNGSADGSVPDAARRFPGVRVLRRERNYGFAGAANAGLASARGRLLAFLNDDVVLEAGWLEKLAGAMAADSAAGAAAGKLLFPGEPRRVASAGNYLLPTGFGRDRGVGEPDSAEFDLPGEVFWASGAACLVRREVFARVGGWDEDFFCYLEDTELGLRARRAGFRCLYVPEAVGIHRGGASASAAARSAFCARNAVYTVLKSFPGRLALRHLPAVAGAHLRALAYLARQGEFRRVFRIERDLAVNFPLMLRKRRQIRKLGLSSLSCLPPPFRPRGNP